MESHLLPPSSWPYLLFSGNDENSDQLVCNIPPPSSSLAFLHDDIQYHHINVPELCRKTVRGCFHGWLVLSSDDHPNDHSLHNPVTSQTIHLPPLKLKGDPQVVPKFHYLLTSPPSDLDSLFFVFLHYKCLFLFCRLHDDGVREWYKVRYYKHINKKKKDTEFETDDWISCAVWCNGRIYGATRYSKQLVCIDIKKPESSGIVIRLLDCIIPHVHSIKDTTFLLESCGELFAIYVMSVRITNYEHAETFYINTYKLDFSELVWEVVESARDRVFFLDSRTNTCSSCSYPSNCQATGSYMYYRDFDPDFNLEGDYGLYAYNMEDKSMFLVRVCPELPISSHVSTWVITKTSRPDDYDGATILINNTKVVEEECNTTVATSTIKADDGEAKEPIEKRCCLLDLLPLHILECISNYLSIFDYLNLRLTCKFCREAFRLKSSATPLLMLTDNDESLMTFIEPTVGHRYNLNIPESVRGARICASNYGWILLLSDKESSLIFFKPFTNSIIPLPNLTIDDERQPISTIFQSFCFSSPPTSPHCRLVGLSFYRIFIASIEDTQWDIIELDERCQSNPIFYGENLYVLCNDGDLGVLKISNSLSWEILVAEPPKENVYDMSFYLVECQNDVLAVLVDIYGEVVDVFKLDNSTLTWEKVESLGEQMIFISSYTSFSAVARIPGMENKIYLTRFHNEMILFYSLENGKFQTHGMIGKGKEAILENFYGTKEQIQYPCWFQPNLSS